jgi:hypothetical protein
MVAFYLIHGQEALFDRFENISRNLSTGKGQYRREFFAEKFWRYWHIWRFEKKN